MTERPGAVKMSAAAPRAASVAPDTAVPQSERQPCFRWIFCPLPVSNPRLGLETAVQATFEAGRPYRTPRRTIAQAASGWPGAALLTSPPRRGPGGAHGRLIVARTRRVRPSHHQAPFARSGYDGRRSMLGAG